MSKFDVARTWEKNVFNSIYSLGLGNGATGLRWKDAVVCLRVLQRAAKDFLPAVGPHVLPLEWFDLSIQLGPFKLTQPLTRWCYNQFFRGAPKLIPSPLA